MPFTGFDQPGNLPAHGVAETLPARLDINVTGDDFRAHKRKIRQKHATFLSSVLSGGEE
jgi:hypothetical protein